MTNEEKLALLTQQVVEDFEAVAQEVSEKLTEIQDYLPLDEFDGSDLLLNRAITLVLAKRLVNTNTPDPRWACAKTIKQLETQLTPLLLG